MREVWRRLKDTAEVEGRLRHLDVFNQVRACFNHNGTINQDIEKKNLRFILFIGTVWFLSFSA